MRTHQKSPMAVFRGYRSQYGAGLGNVLSGILRQAVPMFAPAVKNIGQTLISAGANKLQNIIEDKLGPAANRHNAGTSYDRPPTVRKRKRVVKRKRATGRRPVKRKRRTKADIFS